MCPRDRPPTWGKTARCMGGQSHSVHGGTKPLGLQRDKATRYMEGQGHSVYEGTNYFLLPCSGASGKCPRDRPSAWGETVRCMKGQSHSVHGGTKPLGLRRDKATRYMEGQSHSVYEGAKYFLLPCSDASGTCPRDRPSVWGETTWCMEGQSYSDHGGTKPLGLRRDKATRYKEGCQSHSVYKGTKYSLLPCSCASSKCPRDRPTAWGGNRPVYGGSKPLGSWRDKATRFTKGQSHSIYGKTKLLQESVWRYQSQTIWLKVYSIWLAQTI